MLNWISFTFSFCLQYFIAYKHVGYALIRRRVLWRLSWTYAVANIHFMGRWDGWKYGWFYVLFNNISVLSGRWKVDHEGLCSMGCCLSPDRISPETHTHSPVIPRLESFTGLNVQTFICGTDTYFTFFIASLRHQIIDKNVINYLTGFPLIIILMT